MGYARQDRGDPGAYDRYLAGMDASMRQKVALTAAHLLARGTVADMGMGSGAGSQALASLYPGLRVVGVDVNPEMVERARERYPLPNLEFRTGDIAEPCFPEGSLDGIFDSSVLHHVTTFNGYDPGAAARALAAQARQLREGGVLIVRDFVNPGEDEVVLEVPAEDGDASPDPRTCSTAALLRRFSKEFRSLHPSPGFPLEELPPGPDGWSRFRLSRRRAAEFLLRKDYREDWEVEILEEYTYFSQEEFEARFADLGLRVLASTPLRNPWIVAHRLQGRCRLASPEGAPEEFPPTNYVIVGERIPPGQGVRFVEAEEAEPLGFLEMEHHRRKGDGGLRDLVRRPHLTVDVLPWFRRDGEVFVLVRQGYPRPLLAARRARGASLDGSTPVGYVTEPLSVLLQDRPLGQTVERALQERAGLPPSSLRGFRPGGHYYPSPGGTLEEVRSLLVEVDPVDVSHPLEAVSGFSTSGRVAAVEAGQILRAAQVGGLPDARLEMNVHDLLEELGLQPGAWIGEAVQPAETEGPVPVAHLGSLLRRPPRRAFEASPRGAGFLELRSSVFEERAASGEVLHRKRLEWVAPRRRSLNSVACAVLAVQGGEALLGLDDDDLPAAQGFRGHSELLVAPAWRLPEEIRSLTPAREWIAGRLLAEHGVETGRAWDLGGRYHPSAGVSPEAVYPMALEVRRLHPRGRPLHWVPLGEVIAGMDSLQDGHLRVVARRAAHALLLEGSVTL